MVVQSMADRLKLALYGYSTLSQNGGMKSVHREPITTIPAQKEI